MAPDPPVWRIREPFGRDWRADLVGAPASAVPDGDGPLHVLVDGAPRPVQRCSDGVVRFVAGLGASTVCECELVAGEVPEGEDVSARLRRSTGDGPGWSAGAGDDPTCVAGSAAGVARDAAGTVTALRAPVGGWRPLRWTWNGVATKQSTVEVLDDGPVLCRWRQTFLLEGGASIACTWKIDGVSPAVELQIDQQGAAEGHITLHLDAVLPRSMQAYWRPHSPAPWRGPRGEVHNRQVYAIPSKPDAIRLGPFYNWAADAAAFWSGWSADRDVMLWLGWIRPSRTHVPAGAERLTLQTEPDAGILDLTIPLQEGSRRLALALLPFEEPAVTGPPAEPDRLHARLNGVGLADLHDMTLDWPGRDAGAFPRLWLDPGELPAVRQRLKDWDWLRKRFEAHVDDEILDTHDAPDLRAGGRRLGRDDAGAYLAAGDERHARRALPVLRDRLSRMVTELLDYGPTCDGNIGISLARPWRALVLNLDFILGSDAVDDAARAQILEWLAFVAEVQSTDDAWPATGAGIHRGNDNFHPDVVSARGLAAALLDGHPRQARWLQSAVDEMAAYLDRYHLASGMSRESATYQLVSLSYALQLHAAAARRGRTELADLPALRRSLSFLAATQTPVDERCGHRMLPTVGHVTVHHWCQSLQTVFAWAARATVATDPAFSAQMMAAWQRGGGFVVGLHDYFQDLIWSPPLLLLDATLPAAEDAIAHSASHEGFGAILRSRHEDGGEGYVAWKMGECTGHFDQDEGSLIWYAWGQPLLVDFGCQYNPNFHAHPWLHNRISIDHRADGPPRGGRLVRHEGGDGFDRLSGEVRVSSLFFHGEWPERDPAHDFRHAGEPVPTSEHVWQREILYLHALETIVLVDRIDGDLPTDWNLQVFAETASVDGSRVSLRGQHGVDLEVALLQPAAPRLEISAFAHAGWDETRLPHLWWRGARWTAPPGTTMSAMAERALTVRARAAPGATYCAVLTAHRRNEAPRIDVAEGRATVQTATSALHVDATTQTVTVRADAMGHTWPL